MGARERRSREADAVVRGAPRPGRCSRLAEPPRAEGDRRRPGDSATATGVQAWGRGGRRRAAASTGKGPGTHATRVRERPPQGPRLGTGHREAAGTAPVTGSLRAPRATPGGCAGAHRAFCNAHFRTHTRSSSRAHSGPGDRTHCVHSATPCERAWARGRSGRAFGKTARPWIAPHGPRQGGGSGLRALPEGTLGQSGAGPGPKRRTGDRQGHRRGRGAASCAARLDRGSPARGLPRSRLPPRGPGCRPGLGYNPGVAITVPGSRLQSRGLGYRPGVRVAAPGSGLPPRVTVTIPGSWLPPGGLSYRPGVSVIAPGSRLQSRVRVTVPGSRLLPQGRGYRPMADVCSRRLRGLAGQNMHWGPLCAPKPQHGAPCLTVGGT